MRKRHASTPAQPTVTASSKIGPGAYQPEGTVLRPEDLPRPQIVTQNHSEPQRPCPHCGQAAPRDHELTRTVHDLGDWITGRPVDLRLVYSEHFCIPCGRYFSTDLSALAYPRSHYTHRVQRLAVRLVLEDRLPYRAASWHLWREQRVFAPPRRGHHASRKLGRSRQRTRPPRDRNRVSGLGLDRLFGLCGRG